MAMNIILSNLCRLCLRSLLVVLVTPSVLSSCTGSSSSEQDKASAGRINPLQSVSSVSIGNVEVAGTGPDKGPAPDRDKKEESSNQEMPSETIPLTGTSNARFSRLEGAISALMKQWSIPGAAVAVAESGSIVYSRGMGWADTETRECVQPESLFRIASVSKSITAVAVLRLCQEGRLSLDAKAFGILDNLPPPPGQEMAPRVGDITVRHLLNHSGGWDRTYHHDPVLRSTNLSAAKMLGLDAPVSAEAMIRFKMTQPLDLFPGTKYAYSNLGYCILGRIIERVTGRRYEEYVAETLLKPAGIERMRIGRTRPSERAKDEVRYYDYGGAGTVKSLYPGEGEVPWMYGGFCLESLDAALGWVASATDLVRFALAVEGQGGVPPLLNESSRAIMTERPKPPLWADSDIYYALGWRVRPGVSGLLWWHNGTMPGTTALLERFPSGTVCAILMNSRPNDWETFNKELNRVVEENLGS